MALDLPGFSIAGEFKVIVVLEYGAPTIRVRWLYGAVMFCVPFPEIIGGDRPARLVSRQHHGYLSHETYKLTVLRARFGNALVTGL